MLPQVFHNSASQPQNVQNLPPIFNANLFAFNRVAQDPQQGGLPEIVTSNLAVPNSAHLAQTLPADGPLKDNLPLGDEPGSAR